MLNKNIFQLTSSSFIVLALVSQLLFGLFLPTRSVKAIPVEDATQWALDAGLIIVETAVAIDEFAANALQAITDAYNAAGTWVSTGVDLWEQSDSILKTALDFAWNRLKKMLLNMLVNDIITWIQGGGTPRFITDWQGFLKTAADKAAGSFIDKLGLGFLCSNFSFQLRLALSSPAKFDETATCTLSSAINNLDSFMTDFSKGGWKGWITISESQNNYMGAYFNTLNQKYTIMSEAADAAKNESISSSGFLGDKVCRKIENGDEELSSSIDGWKSDEIPAGYTCAKWEIVTPGRQISDSLSRAINIDLDEILGADGANEYLGAIVDAVISRTIKEGITALTSTGEGTSSSYGISGSAIVPGINAPASVSVDISSYNDANKNGAAAKSLSEQQKLLKENIEKLITEKQTNLGVLSNIKNSQINAFSVLKETLQQNCPLPSGISQVSISSQNISSCSGSVCPCTAKTLERIKVSSSAAGEGIMEKTTTQIYGTGDSGFCGLQNTTVSHQLVSSAVAVESEINNLNDEILALQNKRNQTLTANADADAYQQATAGYMTTYEAWQKGDKAAATSTAETAMKNTKQKAISSNQALLGISSNSFNEFTQQTQKYSMEIVRKFSETQTKRGVLTDCRVAGGNTLYGTLCSAQTIENSYQTSLNSCRASTF